METNRDTTSCWNPKRGETKRVPSLEGLGGKRPLPEGTSKAKKVKAEDVKEAEKQAKQAKADANLKRLLECPGAESCRPL